MESHFFLFQSHYQNFDLTLCQPIPLFIVYIYDPTITLLVYTRLAGSGLAQGGPGAKESALAPELGRGRAEPGRGITTMNDLTWRKDSFFEQGSANGIFDERANEISWWPESESVNDLFRPQDVLIS